MKTAIVLMSLLVLTNSYAYTERTLFKCMNGDQIEITSSLMPTGKRRHSAESSQHGRLVKMDCQKVNSFWRTNGSENCYVGQRAVFSFFDNSGILKINSNGRLAFTMCQITESIR